MIINLRGTSGAGKSTVVKSVMDRYSMLPAHRDGRKRPILYWGDHPKTGKRLIVLGHYESPCGGCDTIKTVDETYQLVRDAHGQGYNVLYEGIMVAEAAIQGQIAFARAFGSDYVCIGMTTPISDCLDGIRARRAERGEEKPLDETNTRARVIRIQRNLDKLAGAGIKVLRLGRAETLAEVLNLLEFTDEKR